MVEYGGSHVLFTAKTTITRNPLLVLTCLRRPRYDLTLLGAGDGYRRRPAALESTHNDRTG